MEKLAEQTVDPVEGIFELINLCKKLNFKTAVGTASNINYATKVLKSLNVFKYFDFIATSDMVKVGKPAPDIFLLAAEKISMLPTDCVVIEDGINGMIAANRANMKCIGQLKILNFETYPTQNQVLSLKDINEIFLNTI